MIQPQIGKGIMLGKPRAQADLSKRAERLDGRKVREDESVADYQRRVIGEIESLG